MDMFRKGGIEMALTTSVLASMEKKIGGNLSDYAMNITVKQAMRTRGEEDKAGMPHSSIVLGYARDQMHSRRPRETSEADKIHQTHER